MFSFIMLDFCFSSEQFSSPISIYLSFLLGWKTLISLPAVKMPKCELSTWNWNWFINRRNNSSAKSEWALWSVIQSPSAAGLWWERAFLSLQKHVLEEDVLLNKSLENKRVRWSHPRTYLLAELTGGTQKRRPRRSRKHLTASAWLRMGVCLLKLANTQDPATSSIAQQWRTPGTASS